MAVISSGVTVSPQTNHVLLAQSDMSEAPVPVAGTHVFVIQAWLLEDTPARLHLSGILHRINSCIAFHSKIDRNYNESLIIPLFGQVFPPDTAATFAHAS